jgi:hypothetical protein
VSQPGRGWAGRVGQGLTGLGWPGWAGRVGQGWPGLAGPGLAGLGLSGSAETPVRLPGKRGGPGRGPAVLAEGSG